MVLLEGPESKATSYQWRNQQKSKKQKKVLPLVVRCLKWKKNGTYITYQGTYQLPVAAVNFSQFLFATKSGNKSIIFHLQPG